MATYAIGDVQGCYGALERLLGTIRFGPADRVWLVGDLVNRGPQSLEVLRWARGLGDRAVIVLGNHDLHLIARAVGAAKAKERDTIDDVLGAPDRDELIAWLLARPLLHREGELVMVHAGLLPPWTTAQAETLARAAEEALRARPAKLLAGKHRPAAWDESLTGDARTRLVIAALTRLRTCTAAGVMCDFDGPPAEAPRGCLPWFQVPGRRSDDRTVVFGHWAALGLDLGPRHIGIDTGCVWGGRLTAVRLEDRAVFSVPA